MKRNGTRLELGHEFPQYEQFRDGKMYLFLKPKDQKELDRLREGAHGRRK